MLAIPEILPGTRQPNRLAQVLRQVVKSVPLYRGRLESSEVCEAEVEAEQLGHFPLLTKRDLKRNFPHNFLGAGADLEELLENEVVELEHTAGTSEERTALLLPRGWWAEQELRALKLNGQARRVLEGDPEARRVNISSPLCSGDICYTGVPSHDERIVGNTLFLSLSRFPFLWGEADLGRMAAEALEWAPQFLDVDPAYGVVFARYCERRGIRLPSVQFVLCSYEFVSACHRRVLERVFQAPVLDLYGSTETGHLLMESEGGWMRPSVETAYLEVVETDAAGIGELVATTLTNRFMPLVRYWLGDLVETRERAQGTEYRVHGRVKDAFDAGGRRVTTRQVDECFEGVGGVLHYQLFQGGESGWRLRYVADGKAGELGEVQERLGVLLGGEVKLESTDLLLAESSGKFRLGYPRIYDL